MAASPAKPIPTLSEWLGGPERLTAAVQRFYDKVPADPVLAPVFEGMDPEHAKHIAAFIAEVFGAGPVYSSERGGHAHMIGRHLGRHLTETQRKRWIDLMLETVDEMGLPSDPEFRSALVGYLEWGARLAVLNSQDGVEAPDPASPMPVWGWGPPGGTWLG